jgi:hypothetical protein
MTDASSGKHLSYWIDTTPRTDYPPRCTIWDASSRGTRLRRAGTALPRLAFLR